MSRSRCTSPEIHPASSLTSSGLLGTGASAFFVDSSPALTMSPEDGSLSPLQIQQSVPPYCPVGSKVQKLQPGVVRQCRWHAPAVAIHRSSHLRPSRESSSPCGSASSRSPFSRSRSGADSGSHTEFLCASRVPPAGRLEPSCREVRLLRGSRSTARTGGRTSRRATCARGSPACSRA